MRHPKNHTTFRLLDDIAAHPATLAVRHDPEGFWVDLAPGWLWAPTTEVKTKNTGSTKVYGWSARDLVRMFKDVYNVEPDWWEEPWACGHKDPVYVNADIQRCAICGVERGPGVDGDPHVLPM